MEIILKQLQKDVLHEAAKNFLHKAAKIHSLHNPANAPHP
jgi:hypothetical protein